MLPTRGLTTGGLTIRQAHKYGACTAARGGCSWCVQVTSPQVVADAGHIRSHVLSLSASIRKRDESKALRIRCLEVVTVLLWFKNREKLVTRSQYLQQHIATRLLQADLEIPRRLDGFPIDLKDDVSAAQSGLRP